MNISNFVGQALQKVKTVGTPLISEAINNVKTYPQRNQEFMNRVFSGEQQAGNEYMQAMPILSIESKVKPLIMAASKTKLVQSLLPDEVIKEALDMEKNLAKTSGAKIGDYLASGNLVDRANQLLPKNLQVKPEIIAKMDPMTAVQHVLGFMGDNQKFKLDELPKRVNLGQNLLRRVQ